MNPILNQNAFFVKEHVGLFKAANNYDVLDPANGHTILHCREERLGFFTKILRFTDYKRMTPFDVEIKTPQGEPVVRVKRGVSFFLSKVCVFNEKDERIGGFKQKFFSLGGKFTLMDAHENPVCTLKGKWTGWDFKFITDDGIEFAHVTKKWAGMGKELFTSADNYVLEIAEQVPQDSEIRPLILAAVMCIDMVLKE
ncbi:MAG: phospholipid scramblase-related protein [Opitutae bacterium]